MLEVLNIAVLLLISVLFFCLLSTVRKDKAKKVVLPATFWDGMRAAQNKNHVQLALLATKQHQLGKDTTTITDLNTGKVTIAPPFTSGVLHIRWAIQCFTKVGMTVSEIEDVMLAVLDSRPTEEIKQ